MAQHHRERSSSETLGGMSRAQDAQANDSYGYFKGFKSDNLAPFLTQKLRSDWDNPHRLGRTVISVRNLVRFTTLGICTLTRNRQS
jgi:hypothetical protein